MISSTFIKEFSNFYYGSTGIDKVTRTECGIQNLSIDYTTDTNGRILSAAYNETGGFTGNYFAVYDNYGNISDLVDNSGNSVKSILFDPNIKSIDTRYDPHNIDDPFAFRARDGFIGIGLWDDGGTAYLQGHLVIPNPWGDAVTNGTTTTTTDDTTDKDGGDDEEVCDPCDPANRAGDIGGLFGTSWYRAVQEVYDHATKENWDCDRLRQEKKEWLKDWNFHREKGWGGTSGGADYYDYQPWSDGSWMMSVSLHYDPKKGGMPASRAMLCETVRTEISVLQTLDCLLRQKC